MPVMSTPREPIAIVGTGCRFPGGASSPSALWKLVEKPRDVCKEISADRFNTAGHYHPDGSHHGTTNVRHAYLLQQDTRVFDAAFFNISPNEADSIDPQQRLLMETVYEALEAGGHTIEGLRGSDTAVYVGTMGVDYNDTLLRDVNTLPTYFATGTNRAIISNRVSYFFDWHGPSMTIDTACSSSLIAVHQGVQALRIGDSRVAIACGTNVILNPDAFVFESKMKMLSPTGRSRMWDADADGYARGEGVAAIVLKRLSDAIADGDHIECLIRETGANQDGHSSGLTVPSSEAQTALIRQTYARAGLDPEHNPNDRPQFFEAHGTGTKAGDPKEAGAIYECFGKHMGDADPLYVGSVKTVIGHTEGAAGLAGLLKASGIIQKGIVPPNLLFNSLNPAIEQYYHGLRVPTTVKTWPKLPEGIPRRVSVNSFGFGGSNAHAIIEQYFDPIATKTTGNEVARTPFVFSAISEASLRAQLEAYSEFLKTSNDINAADLAWTLQSRRSQFQIRSSFAASSVEQLVEKIDEKLASLKQNPTSAIGIRSDVKSASPRILGVFTGQGAQWAAMGAQLIRSSEFVRNKIEELSDSLNTLPESHRPKWSLQEEMLAGTDKSRIGESELSQPLCTVVQIVLVDLLRAAGISFVAVVGHSSGEIAAAYAAGVLSAKDAVRVAYYRGFYAHLASNESGQSGAMMAVGTSWEDAKELCNLRVFRGRLAIAAHNSPASVTLSGDADAVTLAKKIFDEEKKFARMLKVETAYHSHHMFPCGDPYTQAMKACDVQVNSATDSSCSWFSSVTPSEKAMEAVAELGSTYWRDNMTHPVLFTEAIRNAVASDPLLNLAIEIGPHPALKGPVIQTMSDVLPAPLPYCGVLSRGGDDVQAFSDALGFIWTQLGASNVDFASYEKVLTATEPSSRSLVTGLPSYQWNHGRIHFHEGRTSRKWRGRKQPFHEILGILSPDSTGRDMRWTNILKPSEISWLGGHQLQGQTVFPAAGYCAMAIEASRVWAADRPVKMFELVDLEIPRAITFEEDATSAVETLVTLSNISIPTGQQLNSGSFTAIAEFVCYSCPTSGSEQDMELMARASVRILCGTPANDVLSSAPVADYNMNLVDSDVFYQTLVDLGYGYSGSFRSMTSLKRRLNQAKATVSTYSYSEAESDIYLVHPTWLDVAFQASFLAFSAPGDNRLWSLHVPTSIASIRINPEHCTALSISGSDVPVSAVLGDGDEFRADIDIYAEDGENAMVQIEDLAIKPFAPASAADDHFLYSVTKMEVAQPDGASISKGVQCPATDIELGEVCERLTYYYMRSWKAELSAEDWVKGQDHHPSLRDFMDYVLDQVARDSHPYIKRSWTSDTPADIEALINKYQEHVDVRLLSAVGKNIPAAVRGETTILEHMMPNNMLDDFYKLGLGFAQYNLFLAQMVKQITHRNPHANIIEVGAGTGGATKSVLATMGDKMSSYTYTDVSAGFFETAAKLFKDYSNKMTYKTLDVEKSPSTQGYVPYSYDLVIASNVLHATPSMQTTLENVRQLLKPGGYLMLLEVTDQGPARSGLIMGGLSGWWCGKDDGRRYSPTMTPGDWHNRLRKAGFSGVDTMTPPINGLPWPFSIMSAQAVDDRVQFLRRPLSKASSPKTTFIPSLVILESGSIQTAQIAEELEGLLEGYSGQITTINGLPSERDTATIDSASTIINLVDMDAPIFKDITTERMDGLRRVYELASSILWITVGAEVQQPYHMASIAFNRAIAHEEGHISLNHLDFAKVDSSTPKVIAEHLLRQSALADWDTTKDSRKPQLLWTREPEMFYSKGHFKIPRVMSHADQNARLNSSKRVMTKTVSASASSNSIVWARNSKPTLVDDILPATNGDSYSKVSVNYSSLIAFQVAPSAFLFLGIGKDSAGQDMVVLSESNRRDMLPAASASTAITSPEFLVAVASELLATSIVSNLTSGSSLLVHCSGKERYLAVALQEKAASKSVRVTFTYDAVHPEDVQDPSWVKLNAHSPRNILRTAIQPTNITHFLDITSQSAAVVSQLSSDILQSLDPETARIPLVHLVRYQGSLPASYKQENLVKRLQDAISIVGIKTTHFAQENVQDLVVPVGQLDSVVTAGLSQVAQWPTDGQLQVQVRALKPERLFSKNKTYLLVGLSGQIGQSLAGWMIKNGAGCVCLTSRNPKVDQRWLDSFKGAVRIFAMDVIDRSQVEGVINEIRANCLPIAGVANGAMVLHDALFSKMSLEAMTKCLNPKIIGSNHLDQIFFNEKLEFFILFSSSACVVGNSGQANYAAANGYLNSLARNRRSRGLAASTLDIGRVVGIGYVETAGQAVVDQLTRFGLTALSESEIHHMFTETIHAGFARPEDAYQVPDAVVTTGILTTHDTEAQGPWLENPRFAHCIVDDGAADTGTGGDSKKTSLSVSEQLTTAANKEAALQVLEECFVHKLRIILQLGDHEIDVGAPLVELGLDSLVAVEVRSWFLKELKVDIPVLKVVGGASVTDLCERALEKLPEELAARIGTKETSAKTIVKESAPKAQSATQRPAVVSRAASTFSSAQDSVFSAGSQTENSSTQPSSRSESPTIDTRKVVTFSVPSESVPAFIKSEPLSFGQSRFWFLRQLLDDQTTFNVAFYYQVEGTLRLNSLERALRAVSNRHEALRTSFVAHEIEADQAYQKVKAIPQLLLEQKMIAHVDNVATEYAEFKEHNFDLAKGELMRVKVLTLTPTTHYMMINYHHILMDGVSFQVFISDLEKAYIGKPLGVSPRQFTDHSAAQRRSYRNGDFNGELAYWKGVFPVGKQPPILPLLPMAKVSCRAPMKNFDIHQVSTRISPELSARVKAASKAHRSTPFNFYLAALKVMIFSLTDASDLTIGVADANRNEEDVMGSIGFFLNLLAIRFNRESEQSFADAIVEARTMIHSALANSHIPFDVLLQELNVVRSSSHSPFFQAFFDYRQGAKEKHSFGNCEFEVKEMHPGRTAYDITLDVTENNCDAFIVLRAQTSLYDVTGATLLLDTYMHLLKTLSEDTSLTLNDTPCFSQKQLYGSIEVGRGPDLVSDWPETLPHRIDQIAAKHADKLALMDGVGNSLTYLDMVKRTEAIGEALQAAEIRKGSCVLVYQQAASDWICSMLAVMRAGAVYVPMDIRNPLSRLAGIAADCKPSAILADKTTVDATAELNANYATIIDVSKLQESASSNIVNQAQANEPAAILYTSGSTGKPKGITVTHAGLRNEIEGYTKTWGLGAERVLQQSAFTFNHSSDQIYTGLVNGGSVHIVPWSKRGDPTEITKIIKEQSITYTKATPSEYSLWMEYGGDNIRVASTWRFAFGGGESLTRTVVKNFANLDLPELRFFNSYGPTEISISSHKMEIDLRDDTVGKDGRIACGFSLPNYTTIILDEQQRPVPVGMTGEIYIGGAGVSRGYLNNEELTKRHFIESDLVPAEYAAQNWNRLYRTGDIGHLEASGAMVFHSRMAGDTQVKIRGLRIELSDIESNILERAGGKINEAVVVQREGDAGHLVAHVVFAPNHNIQDTYTFLDQLLMHLPIPQYMIPLVAIPHDKLPLTHHSKVDRAMLRALPIPQKNASVQAKVELTETMTRLLNVWYDVLEMDDEISSDINPSTSFFHIGGNSLLVLRLQARIRQVFDAAIPLYELLGANTLSLMANKIDDCNILELIDWEKETAPPSIPGFLEDVATRSGAHEKINVLVTGATGYLGQYLLPMLNTDDRIGTIHCVAVRDRPTDRPSQLPTSNCKLEIHSGDLSSEYLGLEEDQFRRLSSEVDMILHMGATRSFWDNYRTLCPANVTSTKELVKLAAPRQIPIHYISSAGVLSQAPTQHALSSVAYVPPNDGTNGYVATRWASERVLERSTDALGVPTTVYRLPVSTLPIPNYHVVDEFMRFVDITRIIPDFSTWEGTISLSPAEDVAEWLYQSVFKTSSSKMTEFLHLESPFEIDVAQLRMRLDSRRGEEGLSVMPGLGWIGKVKRLGFRYLFTAQNAEIRDETDSGREVFRLQR